MIEGGYDPAPPIIVHKKHDISRAAAMNERLVNDICCVCLIPIEVQIFRNTGVCCEAHRKIRDNDHEPFKAVDLDVTKDGIAGGK